MILQLLNATSELDGESFGMANVELDEQLVNYASVAMDEATGTAVAVLHLAAVIRVTGPDAERVMRMLQDREEGEQQRDDRPQPRKKGVRKKLAKLLKALRQIQHEENEAPSETVDV